MMLDELNRLRRFVGTTGLAVLVGAAAVRAEPPPEQLAALRSQVAEAELLRRDGRPGHGELLRRSASQYRRLGLQTEALEALGLVIASPEHDFDLAEAYRMSADIHLGRGDRTAAIAAGQRFLAVYDLKPEMKSRFGDLYVSGIITLNSAFRIEGKLEEALAINERLLGEDRHLFTPEQVASALWRKVLLLKDLRQREGALTALDEILNSSPGYLADNPIGVRILRAELAYPDQASPEFIAALQAIWDDPSTEASVDSLDLALRLATSLRSAFRAGEAIELEELALRRLDTHRARWTGTDRFSRTTRTEQQLRDIEVTFCSSLQGAANQGRPDASMRALQRLLPMARTQAERDSLNLQIKIVAEKMARPQ